MSQERTENATPKRREKARASGDNTRSALAVCAAGIWLSVLPLASAAAFAHWWMRAFTRSAESGLKPAEAIAATTQSSAAVWLPIAFAALASLVAATAAAVACGSLNVAPAALRWQLSRLSPASGARSLLSREALAQTAMALIAVSAVGLCALPAGRLAVSAASQTVSPRAIPDVARHAITAFWWRAALALSVVAAADVVFARRRHANHLRMTRREVQDERAEQEGKPEVKGRRRSIAMKRARRLRVAALKRAAAVVTNPTHVAVALQYAPPHVDVPVVLAAGADAAAAIVRTAAAFYGVPIIESPELARALFARVDVDEPIPEDLYAGVAAVFAWVLRTRGRLGSDPDGRDTDPDTGHDGQA